jgi:transcriptional regulator with GAF, ATPase, and Fis domain
MQVENLNNFVAVLAEVAYQRKKSIDDLTTEMRREFLMVALKKNQFNETWTARELHMHRNSLIRQMRRLGIDASGIRQQRRLKKRLARDGWAEK